ncbi:hypothetical protein CC85DRAFT_236637, partial [Cutaneotrichosporon oleaginosum]
LDDLAALRNALPTPRKMTALDYTLGVSLIVVHILALLPPPTRAWRLVRAALAPFIAATWVWLGYVPLSPKSQDRWGVQLLFCCFAFRALEHLVVFTPEFEVYRLRPAPPTPPNGKRGKLIKHARHPKLEPEPVPAPWTWAKLDWATSLWWSWRGIGWNYAPPLTESQMRYPSAYDTPRAQHLRYRALYLLAVYAVDGLAGSFMHVGMPQFFISHTLTYAELDTRQRAVVSLATVARILASLEFAHLQLGLMLVSIGGLCGLKGELWEPWGWPAMFGSLQDIWRNPGLNYVWAQAWNQYFRRMYQIWAWVGLGEGILRLPPSGKQLKTWVSVPAAQLAPLAPPTPPASPPPRAPRRAGLWANLVKSVLVFTFSGVFHDISSLVLLLDALGRGESIDPRHVISLAPFFIVQPIAIAAEALLVPRYRAIKRARGIPRHGEGALLTLAERTLGFAYVWVWLGWTAGWFVEGMARLGVW